MFVTLPSVDIAVQVGNSHRTICMMSVCLCDHGHASTELITFTAALHVHAIDPTLMCLSQFYLVPVSVTVSYYGTISLS